MYLKFSFFVLSICIIKWIWLWKYYLMWKIVGYIIVFLSLLNIFKTHQVEIKCKLFNNEFLRSFNKLFFKIFKLWYFIIIRKYFFFNRYSFKMSPECLKLIPLRLHISSIYGQNVGVLFGMVSWLSSDWFKTKQLPKYIFHLCFVGKFI